MKCKNVKLYSKAIVKPFKETCENAAKLSSRLVGQEVIIVDKCINKDGKGDVIYVKESLKDIAFYPIHRKDLKRVK
jgi:hypothetical protein